MTEFQPGFCEHCPVPLTMERMLNSESYTQHLRSIRVRQAAVSLIRVIAEQGSCVRGAPSLDLLDDNEATYSCCHEYADLVIGNLSDALEEINSDDYICLTVITVPTSEVDPRILAQYDE